MNTLSNTKKQSAFTIVELLVVIVVIGILAGITIVSYTGISNKATIASMQSDLSNASKQFKMFHIENGYYPSSVSTNCATNPTNTINLCLKPSPGNSYTTVAYSNPTPQSFVLTEVNGNNTYHITEDVSSKKGIYFNPANWLVIGTQVWAKANLNVGTMVTGVTAQTNNGGTNIVEKYCYNNLEANCTTYGAFYQWDEAMNYVATENAQGICPTGSHVPSDNDWKVLEVQLGMAPGSGAGQVDAIDYRGTDQGTKLKSGGSSGLNLPLAGIRFTNGSFASLSIDANLWSSSDSGGNIWYRYFYSGNTTVLRNLNSKTYGFSVRCIGN